MTTPSSGDISFSDIKNELAFSNPLSMDGFYDIANTAGVTGLMYHNYNNMGATNALSAKTAIWNNYNAGTNLATSNWYNYSRDTGMVMEYYINNVSAYDITLDLVIWDSTDSTQGTIFNGVVNAGATAGAIVNTGLLTVSVTAMSSGYSIAINNLDYGGAPLAPPPPVINFNVTATINSSSDIDNVGAGTNRTTYGPWTQQVTNTFPPPPPFTAVRAVDDSGSMIPVNKRTYIDITLS